MNILDVHWLRERCRGVLGKLAMMRSVEMREDASMMSKSIDVSM
jgi:hypothetical protein